MLIRKSVSAGPMRFTLSRKGISPSIGGRFWRVQAGGTGPHYTLRIPGTGISVRRRLRRL